MRNVLSLIVVICLFSCKNTEKENLNYLVSEWSGKEILFPNTMYFTMLGTDTNYSSKSQYKIISYIDSMGCTSCKLKLALWKELIVKLDSIGNTSVLFFSNPKNKNELSYILKRENFTHPFCIDENDSLNKLNHFPLDIAFQTFLLNKSNEVVAIGNPVHNPRVRELYLKIIQGKTNEQENRVIKTKVGITETSHSFGNFDWQKEQKVIFVLENAGDKPLVIEDVNTSCSCTSVDYSKEPIQPGKEVTLNVTYKAEYPEYFNKTITVYCNAEASPITLKISGNAE